MGLLWSVLAGVVAGLAGGMFGVGGGLIVVPFLVFALKFDQHKAQGTSLLALSLPVAGVGAYNYWSRGSSDLLIGGLVALGIACGSYLGSKIAHGVSPLGMRRAFCAFMICVSLYLVFKDSILGAGGGVASIAPGFAHGVAVLVGVAAGLTGGLFGVGGGIVVVPCLVLLFGFPQHVAQGSSLFALTLPVAAIGAWNYHRKGNVDVRSGLEVAAGIMVGSFLGSSLALGLDPVFMQRSFATFAVVMSTYLLFKR